MCGAGEGKTQRGLTSGLFLIGVDRRVGVKGRETSTQAWETLEALRHGRCGRGTWAGINGSQHFSSLPSPLQPVLPPSGCGLKEQDCQAALQSTVEREGKTRTGRRPGRFRH